MATGGYTPADDVDGAPPPRAPLKRSDAYLRLIEGAKEPPAPPAEPSAKDRAIEAVREFSTDPKGRSSPASRAGAMPMGDVLGETMRTGAPVIERAPEQSPNPLAGEVPPFQATPLEAAAGMSVRPGSEEVVADQVRRRGGRIPGEKPNTIDFAQPTDAPNRVVEAVRGATQNPVARGAVGTLAELGKVGTGVVQAAADAAGLDRVSEFAGGAGQAAEIVGHGSMEGLQGNDKLIAQVTQSIGTSAPAIALGTIGGPALRTLFAQSAAAEYNAGRNAGFTAPEAAARAGIMGAAEAIGERFGFGEQIRLLKGLTNGMPSGDMARVLGAMIRKEVPGEQLTTAIQFLADKGGPAALHPNATIDDYLAAAGETLKVTIAQSAVMGGGPAGIATARDQMRGADAAVERSAKPLAQRQAEDAGFLRPTQQRKAIMDAFDDLVAEHGLSPNFAKRAKEAAERLPLRELPGFLQRFTRGFTERTGAPLDDAALGGLDVPRGTSGQTPNDVAETAPIAAESATRQPDTGPVDAAELLGTPLDEAAHAAATSPLNALPEPTEAQKEAGNYQKGHVRFDGMDVSIENPKGSMRRGVNDDGTTWEVEMPAHYGYIRGTEGADGDHVDLTIGPKGANGRYWVVNQHTQDGAGFDEHKVMTGVESADEAVALYKAGFADGFGEKLFGSVSTEMNKDALRAALPRMKKARPVLRPNKSTAAPVATEPAAPATTGATDGQEAGKAQGQDQAQPERVLNRSPLAAISAAGGISPSLLHDLSTKGEINAKGKGGKKQTRWKNPFVGKTLLFRKGGQADLNELARVLQEAGFLEQGLVERDHLEANRRVQEIVHAALDGKQVLAEADPDAVDAAMRARAEARMDETAGDEYPEQDPEAAAEAEAERRAIMDETSIKPSDVTNTSDEVVLAAASAKDTESALRALGLTDEEIADAVRAQTQEGATERAQGRAQEPAESAPADEAGSAAARPDAQEVAVPERPSGDTDASLARFRPREMVKFRKPYVGKTGAKLVGYEWKWRPEAIVDKRGEDRTIRISDWEQAMTNPETNRDIVHQFQIERTDGMVDVVSAETAAKMLGVSQSTARSSAKRLLEAHMREQREAAQATQQADAIDRMKAQPTPAAAIENGESAGYAGFVVRKALSDGKDWGGRKDEYERGLLAGRTYRFLVRDGQYLFSPELVTNGSELHKRGWRTVDLRADAIWTATGADKNAALLSTQTTSDLKAKTEREAAAQKAEAAEQKRLANKAKADAERDEFTLTGSDRPADVAAAAGQQDIFSAPTPQVSDVVPDKAPSKPPRDDKLVTLRRRVAVLKALKECLA